MDPSRTDQAQTDQFAPDQGHPDQDWSQFAPFFEAEGFPVSGCVDYSLVTTEYQIHANRYREWISQSKHGNMGYLSRGLERRLNPELVFPSLKGVIAVLKPYSPHPVGTSELRYARYLNGPDYHEELKRSLEAALSRMKASGKVGADFDYKVCVDTSAVLERAWAQLCGIGWIGKNTLLIHPKLGSFVFLGVVFTNHSFGIKPEPLKDYCGNCTRCLHACPTGALENHDLDSKKCISYLTIEKRGEWDAAYPTKGFLAGCDLCQEVCPYNTKPVKYTEQSEPASYLNLNADYLTNETEDEYQKRIEGTALERIRFADFKRNLQAVLKP